MGLLLAAVVGLIVGLLARALYRGDDSMGLIKTTLLGLAGGFVAGVLGRAVGWYAPGQGAGIIASILGAMLVLWVARRMSARA